MRQLRIAVEEYTTPNPVTTDEMATIQDMRRLMDEYEIRHIPVLREGAVVGIVSDRDLKVVSFMEPHEKAMIRASDIMSRDPVTVSADTPLEEVAFEMSKRKIGSVIVNENGAFLGIFTATDALNALIELARSNAA